MTKFFVHNNGDDVGVAVTEIQALEPVEGWVMEDNTTVYTNARSNIPLGHKIALRAIRKGSKVVEYGVPIGIATQDITAGEHVHTQNLKTARW